MSLEDIHMLSNMVFAALSDASHFHFIWLLTSNYSLPIYSPHIHPLFPFAHIFQTQAILCIYFYMPVCCPVIHGTASHNEMPPFSPHKIQLKIHLLCGESCY